MLRKAERGLFWRHFAVETLKSLLSEMAEGSGLTWRTFSSGLKVRSCPWCVSFSFSWNLSAQSRCCDGAQCHPIFLPSSPFFYVLALDWIKCDCISVQVHICALSSQLKLLICFIALLNDSKRLLLFIHFSTRKCINFHQGRHLTCTRSVREIRLRQGTGECNYMGFVYFSFRLIWTSGVIMLDTKRRGVFHA